MLFFIFHIAKARRSLTAWDTSHLSWMCFVCVRRRQTVQRLDRCKSPLLSSRSCERCSSSRSGLDTDTRQSHDQDTGHHPVCEKCTDWIPIGSGCLRGISELWGYSEVSGEHQSLYSLEIFGPCRRENRLWAASTGLWIWAPVHADIICYFYSAFNLTPCLNCVKTTDLASNSHSCGQMFRFSFLVFISKQKQTLGWKTLGQ